MWRRRFVTATCCLLMDSVNVRLWCTTPARCNKDRSRVCLGWPGCCRRVADANRTKREQFSCTVKPHKTETHKLSMRWEIGHQPPLDAPRMLLQMSHVCLVSMRRCIGFVRRPIRSTQLHRQRSHSRCCSNPVVSHMQKLYRGSRGQPLKAISVQCSIWQLSSRKAVVVCVMRPKRYSGSDAQPKRATRMLN